MSRVTTAVDATHFVDVVVGALAVALCGPLYLGFFTTPWFLLDVGIATVVSAVVAAVGVVRGWSLTARMCGCSVGFIAVAVPIALRSTIHNGLPTGGTASELGFGILRGWVKLLSVGLPITPAGEPMVALLLIVWVAGYATVTIALASRSTIGPVGPPVVTFSISLVIVATIPDTHLLDAAALATTLLALVLWRVRRLTSANRTRPPVTTGDRPARGPVMRSAAIGPAFVAVVIAVSFLLTGTGLSGDASHRADPRPLESQQIQTPDLITPLAEVQPQLEERPARALFTINIAGGVPDLPGVAMAVLDDFDGAVWTTDDEFHTAGQLLSVDDALDSPRTVRARLTITALRSRFVPVVGWPARLEFTSGSSPDVGFSATSGTLLSAQPLAPGTSYDVTGEFRSEDDIAADALPSTDPSDNADRQVLPGQSPYLQLLTHKLTDADKEPAGKLAAIDQYLRGLPYNPNAAPGHSYADIFRVLTSTRPENDGGAEQHAAAFAVMARDLGYPARVVVGYRFPRPNGDSFDVTTADATAWAEVHFARYGWVAYDPTDVNRTQRAAPPRFGATPLPQHVPAHSAPVPHNRSAVPRQSQPRNPVAGGVGPLVLGSVIGGSILVLYTIAVPVVKALRRRRRRRGSTYARRVIGAWFESIDRLTELNQPVPVSMTPHELARHVGNQLGDRASVLVDLAEPVTTAVFGPRYVGQEDVAQAWSLERALRRDLYSGWHRLRKPMSVLSLRPLVRRRRSAPRRRFRWRRRSS